jgi:hypothetical protein
MSAADIAMAFRDWVEANPSDFADELGFCDVFHYFEPWAMGVGDLIGETGGDYTMALQVWIIVAAWFNHRPDHFEPLRRSVTSRSDPTLLLVLEMHHTDRAPAELRDWMVLRGFLDPAEWRRLVFERKYPRRR